MKPRTRCRQFYSVFRLLIVVIFLKDIAAQPIPYRRHPPPHFIADNRPQHPCDHQPSHVHLPPPPCGCTPPVVVSDKPKTPQTVFFPYTVPIPWPTPFNGSHYAPVPNVSHAKLPKSEPLRDDAYPLYIPCPQFEYVPLYYNEPIPATSPKPRPSLPVGKEFTPAKTIPDARPLQITPSTQTTPQITINRPPKKPEQRPIDPLYEDFPPPTGFVPPPKHTWVPPPENLPEYIPPPPSVLHTRSPGSQHSKKHGSHHNKKHGSQHNTNHGPHHTTKPYVPYGPEPATVASNSPDPYTYYYHDPIPFTPYNPYGSTRTTYYDLYNPRRVDKTPVVTYGSEFVTYTEPSRDGATDDYYTYGPNVMTYIEDAPVPNYPQQRTFPSQTSYQPNPSRPFSWEYQTGPIYYDTQYSRPIPPSPQPVSIGGRSSAPYFQDDTQFEYYEPETFTVVDDDNKQFVYNPYPASPPTKQPPVTIGGRSSIPAPAEKPQPDEDVGYVVYEPEYFDIIDTNDGEKTIVYGPSVMRVNEDEPNVAADKPTKREAKQQQPELYTLTTPEGKLFENARQDAPQTLAKQPPPSSFADLITNSKTKTIK